MQGMVEGQDALRARRRRRSMWLSLLAAGLTAAFAAIALTGEHDRLWVWWLTRITVPPVAVGIAAAVQYRWFRHSGAGAAAAVVYWVFVLLENTSAGQLFFIGAVLQTVAWWISRPGARVSSDGSAAG